jgi:hypothetical protein
MALAVVNGRPYYYTSHRECGRVVTEYGCSGELALRCQELDDLFAEKVARWRARRRTRERRLDRRLRECVAWLARRRAEVTAVEQRTKAQFNTTESLYRSAMAAAGLRRHNRGEWRGGAMPSSFADLMALIEAARRFREGALQAELEAQWVAYLGRGDVVRRAAVEADVGRLRDGLTPAAPDALDAVLVDRVVLAWLDVRAADTDAAAALQGWPKRWAAFSKRRQAPAQRRLLAAVRALVLYRGKAAPVLDELLKDRPLSPQCGADA